MINLEGHGRPDRFMEGSKGDIYTDLDTGKKYECTGPLRYITTDFAERPRYYNWKEVHPSKYAGGGAGVSSWNDLTDKPFEDCSIDHGQTITWDGNPNRLPTVSLYEDDVYHQFYTRAYLVSDIFPSVKHTQSVSIQMTDFWNNHTVTEYTAELEEAGNAMIAVVSELNRNMVIIAFEDNVEVEGVVYPKKGVWFIESYIPGHMGRKGATTAITLSEGSFIEEKVKTLDPKYLGLNKYFNTVESDTLFWDGNKDGLKKVVVDFGDDYVMNYYKISDNVPDESILMTDGYKEVGSLIYDFDGNEFADVFSISKNEREDVYWAWGDSIVIAPKNGSILYINETVTVTLDKGFYIGESKDYPLPMKYLYVTIDGCSAFEKEIISERYLPLDKYVTKDETFSKVDAEEAFEMSYNGYTYVWDGDTTGLDTLTFNAMSYYKIADVVFDSNTISGATTTRGDNDDSTKTWEGKNCYMLGYAILVTEAGNCSLKPTSTSTSEYDFTAPSAGLYALYNNSNRYCDSVTIKVKWSGVIGLKLNDHNGNTYVISVADDGTLSVKPFA